MVIILFTVARSANNVCSRLDNSLTKCAVKSNSFVNSFNQGPRAINIPSIHVASMTDGATDRQVGNLVS